MKHSHAMLALNGWDHGSASSLAGTNCAANCPAWVGTNAALTVSAANPTCAITTR